MADENAAQPEAAPNRYASLLHLLSLAESMARDARQNLVLHHEEVSMAQRSSVELVPPGLAGRILNGQNVAIPAGQQAVHMKSAEEAVKRANTCVQRFLAAADVLKSLVTE